MVVWECVEECVEGLSDRVYQGLYVYMIGFFDVILLHTVPASHFAPQWVGVEVLSTVVRTPCTANSTLEQHICFNVLLSQPTSFPQRLHLHRTFCITTSSG